MSQPTINERVDAIRVARREKGLPVRRLAELAGLTPSTIQEMDSDGWNPTLKTLAAVERALLQPDQPIAAESGKSEAAA